MQADARRQTDRQTYRQWRRQDDKLCRMIERGSATKALSPK